LIDVEETKGDLEKLKTVKRFVDGFLIDLKKIESKPQIKQDRL
jgi:pyruvate-formate lyase-activating enzyme